MSRDILYRLINKGRVVGWEKHEGGKIYHCGIKDFDIDVADCYDICAVSPNGAFNYTQHDRKDQYTGVDIDGVKVFERDIGLLNGHVFGISQVTVVYKAPSFQVKHGNGILYDLNNYFYEIIGIEGVTNK